MKKAFRTPQKVQKSAPIKPLPFHNGVVNNLWILRVQGTRNTDLLKTNLVFEFDLKLEPMDIVNHFKETSLHKNN